MVKKLFKLSLFAFFFSASVCFGQVSKSVADDERIVTQFNNYLAKTHLNKIIRATSYKYHASARKKLDEQAVVDPSTLISGFSVLTIQPVEQFSDPLTFARAWSGLVISEQDTEQLYRRLFLTLAVQAQVSPDSLAIAIVTSSPKVVSYFVAFDGEIKVVGPAIELRGPEIAVKDIDLDKGLPYNGYIKNVKYNLQKDPQRINLIRRIESFVLGGNRGNTGRMLPIKRNGEYSFVLTAVDLKGRVTVDNYDMIELHVFVCPTSDSSKADIAYNFVVRYGSEKYSDFINLNNYKDAINRYSLQMSQFDKYLSEFFSNLQY